MRSKIAFITAFLLLASIISLALLNTKRVERQQFQDIITGDISTSTYYGYGFPFRWDLPDQFPDEPLTDVQPDGSVVFLKPILQTEILWTPVIGNVVIACIFSFAIVYFFAKIIRLRNSNIEDRQITNG